jgi:hypothetical protein
MGRFKILVSHITHWSFLNRPFVTDNGKRGYMYASKKCIKQQHKNAGISVKLKNYMLCFSPNLKLKTEKHLSMNKYHKCISILLATSST